MENLVLVSAENPSLQLQMEMKLEKLGFDNIASIIAAQHRWLASSDTSASLTISTYMTSKPTSSNREP